MATEEQRPIAHIEGGADDCAAERPGNPHPGHTHVGRSQCHVRISDNKFHLANTIPMFWIGLRGTNFIYFVKLKSRVKYGVKNLNNELDNAVHVLMCWTGKFVAVNN